MRTRINHDPGWIVAGTTVDTTPVITDMQAHLRGIGVVTPPQRYPNRQPRTNTVALSDTIVTRADGTQYVIARNTRTRATRARTAPKLTRADMIHAQLMRLDSIHS